MLFFFSRQTFENMRTMWKTFISMMNFNFQKLPWRFLLKRCSYFFCYIGIQQICSIWFRRLVCDDITTNINIQKIDIEDHDIRCNSTIYNEWFLGIDCTIFPSTKFCVIGFFLARQDLIKGHSRGSVIKPLSEWHNLSKP